MAAILKNQKWLYVGNSWTIGTKFGMEMHIVPLHRIGS